MGSLYLLLKVILLLQVVTQIKCSDMETTTSASNDSVEVFMYSYIDNVNDTEYNSTEDESNTTISLEEPFGTTIGTRRKREAPEKNLNEDMENATETSMAPSTTEETVQEMFLEPLARAKRDETAEECSDAGSSDGSSQNQSSGGSGTNEDAQNGSSSSSQGKDMNEAASDDGDDPSNGSSQQDAEDSGSTNERKKRNVGEAEDSFEEGEYRYRVRPNWYREPIYRRYWTSHERKPSRNFIRIPIFPGK